MQLEGLSCEEDASCFELEEGRVLRKGTATIGFEFSVPVTRQLAETCEYMQL
jgi:hypothetical protein